jgi:hypothetical protein
MFCSVGRIPETVVAPTESAIVVVLNKEKDEQWGKFVTFFKMNLLMLIMYLDYIIYSPELVDLLEVLEGLASNLSLCVYLSRGKSRYSLYPIKVYLYSTL